MLFVGVGLLAGVDGVHGNHAFATVGIAAAYDALLAPFVFLVIGAWLTEPRDRLGGRHVVGRRFVHRARG